MKVQASCSTTGTALLAKHPFLQYLQFHLFDLPLLFNEEALLALLLFQERINCGD